MWQESIFSWRHRSNDGVYSAHFLDVDAAEKWTHSRCVAKEMCKQQLWIKKRCSNYWEGRVHTADVPLQDNLWDSGRGGAHMLTLLAE
jgi:hypothetical protein